jgi:hypothetical protein
MKLSAQISKSLRFFKKIIRATKIKTPIAPKKATIITNNSNDNNAMEAKVFLNTRLTGLTITLL